MGQRSLGILFQTMDIRFLIQYLAKSFQQINLENLNFKIISTQEDSGLFFLSRAWWVEQSAVLPKNSQPQCSLAFCVQSFENGGQRR